MLRQPSVPQRVDAATLSDEPADAPPRADQLTIEPEVEQLPSSNHPMLVLRQRPDEVNGILVSHTDT